MTRPVTLSRAVYAMRVYLGSVDYVTVRAQQRFYNRAIEAVQKVADAHGLSPTGAWEQIEREARRIGLIRPIPGRDL